MTRDPVLRAAFQDRILQHVVELRGAGIGEAALRDAWRLLPYGTLTEIISACCAEVAGEAGGRPRDEAGLPVVIYRQSDLECGTRAAVVTALAGGDLVARGFAAGAPITSKAVAIPADRWRDLEVDFERSEVRSAGKVVATGILVSREAAPLTTSSRPKLSLAELKRWYRERIDDYEARGETPNREDDERAAKEALGASRDAVRRVRKELAPPHWRPGKGRRPRKIKG